STGHGLRTTDYGLLKISDFGLAKHLLQDSRVTQSGYVLGTPSYMAPEQVRGENHRVGPVTDVYALGAVLYELLTGRPPFQAPNSLEILRQVPDLDPMPPSRLQPPVPRDLEAITLRCLEKEPGRRYPSALALAEDLWRFQQGKPIRARPVGAPARLLRWCRRKPLIATLLLLLAGSVAAGFLGVTWKWLEANQQRSLANTEKQTALREAYRGRLGAAAGAL